MTPSLLTKELIDDTSAWRLIVRIADDSMSALLLGPDGPERGALFHTERLEGPSVKALENAVYDNPLLLGDFEAVDVIFSTSQCFASPLAAAPLREEMAEAMLPDYDAPRTLLAEPFGPDGELVYAVGSEMYNFVARTFACARFHHSLAIDAAWLGAHAEPSGLYALCDSVSEMNLVGFGPDRRLVYLNRPPTFAPADCAYYILAAAAPGAELTIGCRTGAVEQIEETLCAVRPDARIMPLTLPDAMLRLGRQALQAPFDMLFLTQL